MHSRPQDRRKQGPDPGMLLVTQVLATSKHPERDRKLNFHLVQAEVIWAFLLHLFEPVRCSSRSSQGVFCQQAQRGPRSRCTLTFGALGLRSSTTTSCLSTEGLQVKGRGPSP